MMLYDGLIAPFTDYAFMARALAGSIAAAVVVAIASWIWFRGIIEDGQR